MADHVVELDPVRAAQPAREPQRSRDLRAVVEDLPIGVADVLDSDRRPVQSDRMAAADRERHELIDSPIRLDEEVRACVRQLVELAVGDIRRERVVRLACGRRLGVVLDDHFRVAEDVGVFAVVLLRVSGHLALARRAERNRPLVNRWTQRGELRARLRSAAARAGKDAERRESADPCQCGDASHGEDPTHRGRAHCRRARWTSVVGPRALGRRRVFKLCTRKATRSKRSRVAPPVASPGAQTCSGAHTTRRSHAPNTADDAP